MAPTCLLWAGRSAGALLCERCGNDLPRLAHARCDVCALPISEGSRCGACLSHLPAYDHVCAPFTYVFSRDALVQALKHRGLLAMAPLLGSTMANSLDEQPDIIIPMPLAKARLAKCGFNPAQEIARHVSKISGLPQMPHACRKLRGTAPQAALPWKEWANNMGNAFVRDATLNELAHNLKQTGATRVTELLAARTQLGNFKKSAADV